MEIIIRHAGGKDAEMLARLSATTFYEAFAESNTPENMKAYMEKAFTLEKIASEIADPLSVFLLAVADGEPAGYAKLRGGPVPDCITGELPIEIERLYAGRRFLGTGVGPALMQTCLDEAVRRGRRTVFLGVWEHNHRARTFYSKWGFRIVGEHVFQMGHEAQRDWLMERSAT